MTEQVAELSTATAQPLSYADGAAWLAGEASGDFLASLVLPEVAERRADLRGGIRQTAFRCAATLRYSRSCPAF